MTTKIIRMRVHDAPMPAQKLDTGKLYTGILQTLEGLEPGDREEIGKRLAGYCQAQGWRTDAAGMTSTPTGDSVQGLVHTAERAVHMRDKIDALNEANRKFWAEIPKAG